MELRQQALSDIRKKGDTNMFLTCHYFSKVLMHNTEINVVIPTPEGNEQITEQALRSGTITRTVCRWFICCMALTATTAVGSVSATLNGMHRPTTL